MSGGAGVDGDERFMRRALEVARRAPFTAPNPRVGAVVVKDGKVLGEGWHEGSGSAHAEMRALEGIDARGATLYVNLEPCVHQGRTPPCAPAIVAAGITRVVAAIEDPDERVSGGGFRHLRSAGVEVTTGVLADEARRLNAPFVHQRSSGHLFVTLKLALTLDGRLGAPDGTSRWITSPEARRLVHARRLAADAVLVGAGTVLADNPMLSVRDVPAARQPARVLVDGRGRVPASARLFAPGAEVIVATTAAVDHEAAVAWKGAGAEVLTLPPDERGGVALGALIEAFSERGWLEIYCEGGARLATSLLRDDLVDRLELFYGPLIVGQGGPQLGDIGVSTIGGAPRWKLIETKPIGDDITAVFDRAPAPGGLG